jgi:xanthine/uracil permease
MKNNTRGLARLVMIVSFIAVIGLSIAQAYVRWKLNQNFTFLGGGELEVITAGAFALLIVLVWKRSDE